MRQLLKFVMAPAWLLLSVALAVQSADAQSVNRYPSIDDAWDGTDYRALVERVETAGLALPTLSNAETKKVFERMVSTDNIFLRVGLNKEMSVTIRFQRLDGVLPALHDLVALYSTETQKGKPYGAELARLRVYESKVSAAWLAVSDQFLSSLEKDGRYKSLVAELDKTKNSARQIYSGLVQGMTDTKLYSKPDMLVMIECAMNDLPSYHPIFTDQDRQEYTKKLTQQISVTTDQQLKAALTQLRDAIEHRRIRT